MELTKEHRDWIFHTVEGQFEANALGNAARRALDNTDFWGAVGSYLLALAIYNDLVDPSKYNMFEDTYVVLTREAKDIDYKITNQFIEAFFYLREREPDKTKERVS